MSEAVDLEEQITEEEIPVLDDMDAEYLMGRIRQANEQYEKLEAWYAYNLEKAKEVRNRTVEWAEAGLRKYFETVPKRETKTQQSYELPSGKLVLKHQEPKYKQDNEALVPWLKQNGMADYIKVEETAKWADLKKTLTISPDGTGMITSDGEIVPGVTVTPQDDKFTVTLK